MVYRPYIMAERKARVSPRRSSEGGLVGKGFVICPPPGEELEGGVAGSKVVVELVRSEWETRTIPMKEARTPRSLRMVNFSMWVSAPIIRVQIDDVEVRIVVLATVVCWRHAMAK